MTVVIEFTKILIIFSISAKTYIVDVENSGVCFSHMNSLSGYPKEGSYHVLKQILDHNCTYIVGNLILSDLSRNPDGSDPDLGFLQTIKEISGYLIIMHSNLNNIPLSNLQVIRAKHGGYELHSQLNYGSLVIRKNYKDGLALEHVDLRSLKSIAQGSIYIYDNPGLAYLSNRILWTELFESVSDQKVYTNALINETMNLSNYESYHEFMDRPVELDKSSASDCSSACPQIGNRSYCWGPSLPECQIRTKCQSFLCDRCITNENSMICCHEQCLGGCYGPLATQCISCKEYNNSGLCVSHCPPKTIKLNGELVKNKEFKYRLGGLCVTDCPVDFLIEDDVCVTRCSEHRTNLDGRHCIECLGECPKSCKVNYTMTVTGQSMKIMDLRSLQQLKGCTLLDGDLVLTKESFQANEHMFGHLPVTEVGQLWLLHSLREVTGYVYLDLANLGNSLTNFSFLENLHTIGGYLSAARVSMIIMNSQAEFPGLRNLRYAPHGSIIFLNNPKLCYTETLPWIISDSKVDQHRLHDLPGDLSISVHNGSENEFCTDHLHTCHHLCNPAYGCWGPGPEQCVKCQFKLAGTYRCVEHCDDVPGFFTIDSASILTPINKSQRKRNQGSVVLADEMCAACDPECGKTCTGPGANECIGPCKHSWHNGECVPQCPQPTYLNVDRGVCESCQTHCHQRQFTKQPVCSGPGRYPGIGGCNKCEKFGVISSTSTRNLNEAAADMNLHHKSVSIVCIRGDCPPETYLTTELVSTESMFATFVETYTSVIPVCKSCPPKCPVCTSFSLLRANNQRLGCVICDGFWFRDTCVNHCPIDNTYGIWLDSNTTYIDDKQQSASTPKNQTFTNILINHWEGYCLACDEQCHAGCWGPKPDQCYHCLHVKISKRLLAHEERMTNDMFTGSNKSNLQPHDVSGNFICLPQCPPNFTYIIKDRRLGNAICHYRAKFDADIYAQLLDDQQQLRKVLQALNNQSNRPNQHPKQEQPHIIDLVKQNRKYLINYTTFYIVLILITFTSFVLFIYYRYRKHYELLKRCEFNSFETLKLILCPSFLRPGMSMHDSDEFNFTTNHYQTTVKQRKSIEAIELKHVSMNLSTGSRQSTDTSKNQIMNAHKAPNLGRLVMIYLDDLYLNESVGPLGTGAFGAVYRGIWKVRSTDYNNLPNLANILEATDEDVHLLSNYTNHATIKSDTLVNKQYMSIDDELHTLTPHPRPDLRHSSLSGKKDYKLYYVAVKILNEVQGSSDLQALLDEAKVMASVSHRHCLPLLGICLSQTRKCLVSAYVVNGSLDRYLRIHAPDISSSLLLEWAAQIADGMAYLQSRGIIHRDLATRNVLVTSGDHLQITDFGLAKMLESEEEEKRNEVVVSSGRVPIRWLARETLTHRIYSFKTDVWAYGVTLWEIFTFGDKPYDRIETAHVKDHVLAGGRLPQPDMCTLELYQIMLNCWNENPDLRPCFVRLHRMFKKFTLQPQLYIHSRAESSLNTSDHYSSTGGESRSRGTIYPVTQLYGDRLRPLRKTGSFKNRISNSPSSGNSNCGRIFDVHTQTRNSLLLPTHFPPLNRMNRANAQNRLSIGGRAENALTRSIITNSDVGQRWNRFSLSAHSHPTLMEVNQVNDKRDQFKLPNAPNSMLNNKNMNEFDGGVFSADSWASSGRHLLASDQDSSLSQLMLSNLGYVSADSHASIVRSFTSNQNQLPNDFTSALPAAVPLSYFGATERNIANKECLTVDQGTSNLHPSFITSTELAAGYVWPQWPAGLPNPDEELGMGDIVHPNEIGNQPFILPNTNNLDNPENLPFLNRQLWLRRNARQRSYYLRQSQLLRVNTVSGQDNAVENQAFLGPESIPNQLDTLNAIQEDSDADNASMDRYWPDPTVTISNFHQYNRNRK